MHLTHPSIDHLLKLVSTPEALRAYMLDYPDFDLIKHALALTRVSEDLKEAAPILIDVLWEQLNDDPHWWDRIQTLGTVTKILEFAQDPDWINRLSFLWDPSVPYPSRDPVQAASSLTNLSLGRADPNFMLAKTIHHRTSDNPALVLSALQHAPLKNMLRAYYEEVNKSPQGAWSLWKPLAVGAHHHLHHLLPHLLPIFPSEVYAYTIDAVLEMDTLDPLSLQSCMTHRPNPLSKQQEPALVALGMEWTWRWTHHRWSDASIDEMADRWNNIAPYVHAPLLVSLDAKNKWAEEAAKNLEKHINCLFQSDNKQFVGITPQGHTRWEEMWRSILSNPNVYADEVIHQLQKNLDLSQDEHVLHRAMDVLPEHALDLLAKRLERVPDPVLARHPKLSAHILTSNLDTKVSQSRSKKM